MKELDDKEIRLWILNDEYLYLQAREFGKGGDDEMYEALPEFIQQNRQKLVNYIQNIGKCTH